MNQPTSASPEPELDPRAVQTRDEPGSSQRPNGFDETAMYAGKDPDRNAVDIVLNLSLPTAFGRYAVRSILGRGGFGVVYLGHDTQLDRPVAIKVLRRSAGVSPEDVERFLQEAQRARLLDDALATIAEALRYADKNEDLFQTAELHRQRGELLLALSSDRATEAESCFQTSLDIARQQHSQAWQLRTTTSLARLWHSQGQTPRARQALAEIYNSYSEGFSTPDLIAAKCLLKIVE